MQRNVYDLPLELCSADPATGYHRSGRCETLPGDTGSHVVCAHLTDDFLRYTAARGNDLMTPRTGFPGLVAGQRWCVCADRYAEAAAAGHAPIVILEGTNKRALLWPSIASLVNEEPH